MFITFNRIIIVQYMVSQILKMFTSGLPTINIIQNSSFERLKRLTCVSKYYINRSFISAMQSDRNPNMV